MRKLRSSSTTPVFGNSNSRQRARWIPSSPFVSKWRQSHWQQQGERAPRRRGATNSDLSHSKRTWSLFPLFASFPPQCAYRIAGTFEKFMLVLAFCKLNRRPECQFANQRHRHNFSFGQNTIQILEIRRNQFDVGPSLREMVQAAFEFPDGFSGPARSFRKENQGVALAHRFRHLVNHSESG